MYKFIFFHTNTCKTHGRKMAKERTKLTLKPQKVYINKRSSKTQLIMVAGFLELSNL